VTGTTPLLAARDVVKTFGRRVAVDHVSIELRRGETFGLVGPNGAGKTTTLRMLAGLIAPTTGRIELEGQPVTPRSAQRLRRLVGLLTESPGLWDRLSVRQNLMTYARLYGLAQPGRAVEGALERFRLRDRADDDAAQLSKGLRQRVALARTLLHDPAIVLLDEPTSGLDPESARGVRDLVRQLQTEDRAVVVCTHNLDEVERLATRVGVLRTRLLAIDTPQALRARLFGMRVRVVLDGEAAPFAAMLRSGGIADVRADGSSLSVAPGSALSQGGATTTPDLVRMLVEAGARVESVGPDTPSLEDVYLRVLDGGGGP
jgi:ABC-2 type transport system ATP-binding protein